MQDLLCEYVHPDDLSNALTEFGRMIDDRGTSPSSSTGTATQMATGSGRSPAASKSRTARWKTTSS